MQSNLEHDIPLLSTPHLPVLYLCWREVIDLTFGLLGLAVLMLVLPVLALLIYLDSPGSIFYSQERVGYQGKNFRMYKLRSMYVNSRHAENAIWASKGDTQVTKVGHFLRATHMDELPQVLNILYGEMSLIGPRPEQEKYVHELEKTDPLYRYRLVVRPGLTGWAQVNYGYGSSSQDELKKLPYDLYYIEHQSFMLDIVILLRTIAEVVSGHGQ